MYKFQQPEDQTQFCLPLNRDTEHLYYNTYLVIDAGVLTEPRVWQISKINRSNSKGIAIFTCAQDLANQHILKADYDEDGNVVAWWADWYSNNVEPVPAITDDDLDNVDSQDTPTPPSITSTLTCSGKPQFKVGGSAKTFTVTYKDEDGNVLDMLPENWSFTIDGDPVPEELLTLLPDGSKNKVKFLGDDSYIGKTLTITCTSGDAAASLNIEIIAL